MVVMVVVVLVLMVLVLVVVVAAAALLTVEGIGGTRESTNLLYIRTIYNVA